MIEPKDREMVRQQLEACLQLRFPDASVQIGEGIHYKGLNVVVTSNKFRGLLAEQRFHHVVRAIPKDVYEKHLQRGVVWFELAPGEGGKDLMRMPRSTDITAAEESAVRRILKDTQFFKKLASYFDSEDEDPSGMTFETTRKLLSKAGIDDEQVERCLLYMIQKGAYCDAHIVNDLMPKLASEHAA
ncbi:MAG: hypothetical protein KF841_16410 [Phycisphaerae bacterium]|nr:hypothetical protein [Phycisphaerae bacterium]